MAQKKFTFRLTSEGVEDLRRELKGLGADGDKVFDNLAQSSPQLASALKKAEEQADRTRARIKDLGRESPRGLKAMAAAGDEAAAALDGMAGRIGPLGSALRALGPVGLGVAAGIGAIGLAFGAASARAREALTEMDGIAKVADRIGVTTNALQELRFAAGLAGGSAQELDQALQGFARRLGQARLGTGEMAEQLRKIDAGLLATVSAAGSTEEGMSTLLKVISETPDAANRLTLATAAFGESAAFMVEMVEGGTAALEANRQKARELGLVYDEDLLRSAEDINDQLSIQQQIIDVQLNQAMVGLGPVLVDLAEGWAEVARWVGNTSEAFRDVSDLGVTGLEKRLTSISNEVNGLIEMRAGAWTQRGRDEPDKRIAALMAEYEDALARLEKMRSLPTPAVRPQGNDEAALLARRVALLEEMATAEDKAREANARRLGEIAELEEASVLSAEDAARLRTQAAADLAKVLDKETKGRKDAKSQLDAYLSSLDSESVLMGLSGDAREVQRALLEAEAKARVDVEAGLRRSVDLTAEEVVQIERAVAVRQKHVAAARKAAEAQRTAERAAAEAQRERERATEAAIRESERMVDSVTQYGADRIVDGIMDPTRKSWSDMLQGMLRDLSAFFIRAAAEAALRPIAVRMVAGMTGGVGGSSSAMAGGSPAGGGGMDLYGSVFGAVPKDSIFGGSSEAFSGVTDFLNTPVFGGAPANAPINLMPGTSTPPGMPVGGTPPVTMGNVLGAAGFGLNSYMNFQSGNTIGGIGNAAASVMMFIPGAQPFAPFVAMGSQLLGGLFMDDGPKPNSESIPIMTRSGRIYDGDRRSMGGGSGGVTRQVAGVAADMMTTLFESLDLKVRDGAKGSLGNITYFGNTGKWGAGHQQFDSPEQAIEAMVAKALTKQVVMSENSDVLTALRTMQRRNGKGTPDVDAWTASLQFAGNFAETNAAMRQGYATPEEVAGAQAAAAVRETVAQLEAYIAKTKELGLSVQDARGATQEYVKTLVGLREAPDALGPLDQAIAEIEARGKELPALFKAVGLSADLAQQAVENMIGQLEQQVVASANQAVGSRLYGRLTPEQQLRVATQRANENVPPAYRRLVDDMARGAAGGDDPWQEYRAIVGGLTNAMRSGRLGLQDYSDALTAVTGIYDQAAGVFRDVESAAQGATQAQRAATQAQRAAAREQRQSAAGLIADQMSGLSDYIRTLTFGDASALTPAQRLSEAQRQFQAVSGAAAAGDYQSLSQVRGIAEAYLTTARGAFGSGSDYTAAVRQVSDALGRIATQDREPLIANTIQVEMRAQTTAVVSEVKLLRAAVLDLKRELRNSQPRAA